MEALIVLVLVCVPVGAAFHFGFGMLLRVALAVIGIPSKEAEAITGEWICFPWNRREASPRWQRWAIGMMWYGLEGGLLFVIRFDL